MSWSSTGKQSYSRVQYKTGKSIEELPVTKLANVAQGIDFYHLSKPPNLANSQVLQMVEREEHYSGRNRQGSDMKEVVWPPPASEEDGYFSADSNLYNNQQVNGNVYNVSKPTFKKNVTPPKSTITLRESAPFTQAPPPVYSSQPVTVTFNGGARMRGDQKWPPEKYKEQAKVENEARISLARGPAFRPKKQNKDYRPFFEKNALPMTYPGYKAPPGTQHYYEPPITNY